MEKRDEELKDREAYIRQLEETLRQQHIVPSRIPSANSLINPPASASILAFDPDAAPADVPLPVSPAIPRVELELDDQPVTELSPSSTQRFNDLKHTLAVLDKDQAPDEETQARVDNLLRCATIFSIVLTSLTCREMAVKESSQRAIIEQQFVQIADLQRANQKLSKDVQEKVGG